MSNRQPKLLGRILQGRHVLKEDRSFDDRLQLALIPRVRDEQVAKPIERASGDIPVDPEQQIIEVVVMEDPIQGIVSRFLRTWRQVELCLGNQVRSDQDVLDQFELVHVLEGEIDGIGVEIGPRRHQGASIIRLNTADGSHRFIEKEPTDWEYVPGGHDLAVCDITEDITEIDDILVHSEQSFLTPDIIKKFKIGIGEDADQP